MTAASTTPFFGRAYSLSIKSQTTGDTVIISSDTFEPEALRFTFDIQQVAWSEFWHAEIAIYNANGPIPSGPNMGQDLYNLIIGEGDIVTVCAGYQADYPGGTPPAIWTGPVFYTIQDRLDVVDQRLIIHCVLARALTIQNFMNATLPLRATNFSQAKFIAENAKTPININSSQVKSILTSTTQLPRGKSYFGNPHNYLQSIADQNNLLSFFDSHTWNINDLGKPLGSLIATYAPVNPQGGPPVRIGNVTLSLIGQPQQTQLGVDFRVLLDPNVQIVAPLNQVAVMLQYVRQAPIAFPVPQGSTPPRPLANQYAVIGVRFTGDTRGNAWYSDITGVSQVQDMLQLLGVSKQADVTQ
jgi:hypothetical protein